MKPDIPQLRAVCGAFLVGGLQKKNDKTNTSNFTFCHVFICAERGILIE